MKRIGLLCLALVLALGSLGIGYAAWTETLTIGGTVTTGDLDVDFTAAMPLVGTAVIAVDNKSVTWTVINAFPGQAVNLTWTIANRGTIPAVVTLVGQNITPTLGMSITTTPGLAGVSLGVGASVSRTTTVTIMGAAPELTVHTISVSINATAGP